MNEVMIINARIRTQYQELEISKVCRSYDPAAKSLENIQVNFLTKSASKTQCRFIVLKVAAADGESLLR
jgi:hypothetical protein